MFYNGRHDWKIIMYKNITIRKTFIFTIRSAPLLIYNKITLSQILVKIPHISFRHFLGKLYLWDPRMWPLK